MKKIITVVLAVLMLLSVAACAENSTQNNNQNNNQVQSDREKLWTKKNLDYDGYEFVILSAASSGKLSGWDGADIESEAITGNEVLDEVYNRNRLIEQTYNIKIRWIDAVDATTLKNTIMAGNEEDGALISRVIKETFALMEAGLILDLNNPEFTHLDLKQDWYSQTIQRDTTIAGKLYFVNGDMLFTDETAMWITLFNKDLAEKYVTDIDLYEAVRSGKWTVDTFMKYAALATTELKADDKMTYEDQWGYVGEAPNVAALVTGAGYRYAQITPDGGVVCNVFDANFQNVFKKCYETVDNRFCLLASDIIGVDSIFTAMDATFYEGRALFMITGMNRTLAFREMDTDFGILPLPKLNEAQTDYYTWTTYNTNVVSVPYSCTDPERTSAIMEALFEESSFALRTAYIDKAVKYQSTRDDESIEMLDIIINNTVYDIGVVYDFGKTYSQLNDLVKKRAIGALSSTLKKAEGNAATGIADLLENIGYTG